MLYVFVPYCSGLLVACSSSFCMSELQMAFYCSGPISKVRCYVNDCCVIGEWQQKYTTCFCTNNIYSSIKPVHNWPDEPYVSISTLGMFALPVYDHTFCHSAVEWYNFVTVVCFTVQQMNHKYHLVSSLELHIPWNDVVFMNFAGLQIDSW